MNLRAGEGVANRSRINEDTCIIYDASARANPQAPSLKYIDLAKPKSGAPGLFILSENERLWNCPPFGFPGNCLIMSFSSLPN